MTSLNRNSKSSTKTNTQDKHTKPGKSTKNSLSSEKLKAESSDPSLSDSPPDPMKMAVPVPYTALPVAQPPPVLKGYKTNEKKSVAMEQKGKEPHLTSSASSSAVKKVSPSRLQSLLGESTKGNRQGKTPTKQTIPKVNPKKEVGKLKVQKGKAEVKKSIDKASISSRPDNTTKNQSKEEVKYVEDHNDSMNGRSKNNSSELDNDVSDNLKNDPEELKEKLKELDIEIEILKQEQDAIEKQKTEYDSLIAALQIEMEKFYKKKEEDIIAFEQEKLEHARQIAKEREELDAKLELIDGGMKEELEVLRKENQGLREEIKAKDQAHASSLDKMRKEMNKILKANEELQKKITEITDHKKLQNKIPTTSSQTRIKTPDAKSGVKNILGSRGSKVDNINPKVHSKIIADTKPSAKRKDLNKSPSNSRTNIKGTNTSLTGKISTPNKNASKNSARNQPESAEKIFNNTFKCNAEDKDEVYDMVFPPKYHSGNNGKILSSKSSQEGKITKVYSNGKTEMLFGNGVRRESFPDGYTIIHFNNKDIKQTYPNGKIVYYFAEAKTTQTTFPDGLQVFKFPNNQLEKHYTDGHKEIA